MTKLDIPTVKLKIVPVTHFCDTFYLGIDEATKYLVLVKCHGSYWTFALETKVFYKRLLRNERSMTISIILNLTLTRVILLVSPS